MNLKGQPDFERNRAYQFQPVCIRARPHEIVDVCVHHPVRYHCEPGFRHRNSYQRQDIRMPKCFPRHNFFAEPLDGALSVHKRAGRGYNQQLTPTIFCKSLFEYVLRTFTATSRPQYTPFHTSANPPLYNAVSVRSYQTVTFMVFGRRA